MKKTVLITGASSGFGKETAKHFQKEGWNVIATMRNPEKETDLTQLDNVMVTQLDVQDDDSIQQAVKKGVATFGTIDVLVNNAGYGLMGVFESATTAQIQQQFGVNVFGLMAVTKAVLPIMRQQQSGVILNLSSVGGAFGFPFGSLYNSTKFAVEGFSEALSHELAPFHIAVKIIEPGGVATNFRNALDIIENKIPEYNPFMSGFFQRYGQPTAHLDRATPEQVAATIFQAATDNTQQLRYIIGADAAFYIHLKQQHPEDHYIKAVREFFVD